jgi:hypothetical protein
MIYLHDNYVHLSSMHLLRLCWFQILFLYMCSAMEECVTRFPQYADFKRMEDENTALHIAASNDKLEVLKYLCSLVRLMYSSCFTSVHTISPVAIYFSVVMR